jgi:hypothetical protein
MSKQPTLAQEWQDFSANCYRGMTGPDSVAAIAELRLAFYSGWYACMGAMSKIHPAAADEALAVLMGWGQEFETLAARYVREHRKDQD